MIGEAAYRLLLLAYPRALRHELGAEIYQVFRARVAAARRRGVGPVLALLLREIAGSLSGGLRARWGGTDSNFAAASPSERALAMLDTLLHDLRSGLRAFRVAPGFAFAAVVVLAVAIGANSAVFSVINAVLLRPLPLTEPDRLVSIFETNPERGWTRAQVAAANYLDWRERAISFTGIAAHNDWLVERAWLRDGEPSVVNVNEVTANFFDVLGVELTVGHAFEPDDDWLGGERRIVLSHYFWSQQFGADPAIVGRGVVLDGETYTVVGVASREFRFPFAETDAWAPVAWDPGARAQVSFRRAHGMRAIGRLAPGIDDAAASAELTSIAATLEAEYPETNTQMGVGTMPLHDWVVGDTRNPLTLVFLAVGLVLVIACANVANLQLARATDRHSEMSLRAALGAPRLRLVRQNLVESLVLASLGGAVGLALGVAGVRALVRMLPADFPRRAEVGIDGSVLAFTLGSVAFTGIVFGLAPSLLGMRTDRGPELRGGRASGDRSRGRASAALVAVEVALVLPVAIGAVLMFRTLRNINDVDPGFDPADTTVLGISLPRDHYGEQAQRVAFFDSLLTRLRSTPGVQGAALSTRLPFVNQRWSSHFRAESWAADQFGIGVRHDEISIDLFRTMGVPFLEGRDFESSELGAEPVAIVNRALAEAYFPGSSPIGERLCFDRAAEDCRFWYRVVGVVDNVRRESLTADEKPSIYASMVQDGSSSAFLLVRSSMPTADVVAQASAAVRDLDAALPFHTVTTLADVVAESVSRERLLLALFGAFATVAALLAGFGVYSVVAYSTARRTREIGIRVSLGARPGHVMRAVLGRGLAPVALGLAAGLTLAGLVAGVFAGMVYGVGVRDPVSFLAVALGLGVIALVACAVPGARAVRVDPVVALRAD